MGRQSQQFTFELYWSPEGKLIATVHASTKRAAIRKAPQPYHKYLGEIYAVCLNPSRWYGYVTACEGHLLLGGVKHHQSARFATRKQASDWTAAIVKGNSEAGRQIGAWGQNMTELEAEVTA